MKVNIESCVIQLCAADGFDGGRKHTLVEMVRNLKELRERTARGDLTALDEFFGLYVFNGDAGYKYRRIDEPYDSWAFNSDLGIWEIGAPHCTPLPVCPLCGDEVDATGEVIYCVNHSCKEKFVVLNAI